MMIDLMGKAGFLAGLIDFQSGSVVSKEVIRENTGTVTLFAFDQGQGLSEHTAPFNAMVHILEGKAEIVISSQPHVLQAGQAMIMPANEPHALKAVEPFKMLLIMIKA